MLYSMSISLSVPSLPLFPFPRFPRFPRFPPHSPTPGTSQAFGPGLVATVAGEKAYFTVRLRDQFQNVRRNRSSIDFDLLQMVAVHYEQKEMYYVTDKATVDTQDATYAFSYIANKTGTVELNVKVDGEHVATGSGKDLSVTSSQFSPYNIVVTSTTADALASTAEGWALREATSSVATSFTITIRDRFTNLR